MKLWEGCVIAMNTSKKCCTTNRTSEYWNVQVVEGPNFFT